MSGNVAFPHKMLENDNYKIIPPPPPHISTYFTHCKISGCGMISYLFCFPYRLTFFINSKFVSLDLFQVYLNNHLHSLGWK
jgi:hypothetical protein